MRNQLIIHRSALLARFQFEIRFQQLLFGVAINLVPGLPAVNWAYSNSFSLRPATASDLVSAVY